MNRLFITVACALCMATGAGLMACTQSSSSQSQTVINYSETSASDQATQKDYYADDDYEFPAGYDTERSGIETCTVVNDVTYYSSTVEHDKTCAVILPPGYSETESYPVVYCLHGWGGDSTDWQEIVSTYENMVADGIARKALLVLPNVFTSTKDYGDCEDEEIRLAYDAFVNDLANCLMPFIESHYNVLTGRENTAIIGRSQGGTESLAIGFALQEKIGYIASLAPCPGVIPTDFYKDSFWSWPILDDFTIADPSTEPYYILLNVGSEDPWDIDCTVYYDQVMTEKGIPHVYYMIDGADHGFSTWSSGFYNFMKRIF